MRGTSRCFLFILLLCQSAIGEHRPNVLLIVADDLNCALGPYGDSTAVTPNLNRLAKRGVVFQRAYCQQAVCNPSRSSFLTGLRPDTVGVDDLRKYFRETAPEGDSLITLPEHFKNHAYFCQNIGKLFHNMGETQDRRSWSIDEVLFRGTHAADTVFSNTPASQKAAGIRKAPVTEQHDVPDLAYRDGQIASLAASVLQDYPETGKPFFLAVGFWRPHLPFVAPKKYWELYDKEQIPLPTPSAAPSGVPEIALHPSREITGYDGVPQDRPFTEDEVRHFRHGYYASISFLDAKVGQILDALEASEHDDNTIVVLTSDHGFHIGEHSLWGKTSNFELDARVPLIICDPRQPSGHGQKTEAIAELVDLFPTLAELAGIQSDVPVNLEGTSQAPVVRQPGTRVKEAAFTQHQRPFYARPEKWTAWGYSVRTKQHRYTEWRALSDGTLIGKELYNHLNDSKETINVADQYPVITEGLSRRLRQQFSKVSGD